MGTSTLEYKEWKTLYTRTASGNINYWCIWTEGAKVYTHWGAVGTDRPQTDSYVAEGKNIGRSNETSAAEQAQKEAQAKFDKQLRLKYVRSIEEAENSLNIKPMRAYVFDEKRAKKIKWPVHVQPKYNGVRCMAYNRPDGSVRLMSRGGKDYDLPHVQEELRGKIGNGWCLDGEIYVHGMSLQTIRHHVETYTDESLVVKYVCYDCTRLPADGSTWVERFHTLRLWFSQNGPLLHVLMSDTFEAGDRTQVKRLHDRWVDEGYEGAMVRTMTGLYKMAAKSTDLLKYKMFIDDEFRIIGWGVGRDGVIVYRLVQEDGLEFEARPKGNEAERAELLKMASTDVGKLLTVRYQERSDDNVPIFPVGVAIRPRKDMD